VIDEGRVAKRIKKPSKPYRDRFGHTPLSAKERIPCGGKRLIIGTGGSGSLPIMPDVRAEAERRGIDIVAAPTDEALRLLGDIKAKDAHAILHVTCERAAAVWVSALVCCDADRDVTESLQPGSRARVLRAVSRGERGGHRRRPRAA
jgi:hypothetical protein